MIITIESPSGKRKWRIEPVDNGLCYRLMKTSLDPNAKNQWINCECYSGTIQSALERCVERILKDPDDPTHFELAASDLKRNAVRCIKKYLEELGVEIEKEVGDGTDKH